ncbi:tail fiber domain-containing protein, partial [Enterobacter chuandaensis]|uniref:tail fiber domain-containing protein n=1 Tax=Enterobacter chuandaensis TaxID=2497875 RepID=UPI0039C1BE47
LGDLATENSSGIRKQLFKVDPQLGSTVELDVFTPGTGVKNGSGLVFKRSASDAYVIMQFNTSGDYEVSNLIMGIDTASRNVSWDFQLSGNAVANSGSWLSNSDKDIKTNIKVIESPLEKMRMMHGYTWDRLDDAPAGQGFIAQELMEVIPTAVFEGGRTELKDGTVVEKTLSVDVTGASAALHHEAILALMDKIEDLKKQVEALQPGS